jgi:Sortase domain
MRTRGLARIAAAAAGTLVVLSAPAVLADTLADDGTSPVAAGVPAAGEPTPSPGPAPVGGATVPPGRADVPAVPAAPRPTPLGVAPGGLPPSPPIHVMIPALGVSSDLELLGVGPDGTLSPPTDFERAGWFSGGVEPGQPGPAVIVGHVDSRSGPAVFHALGDLARGDAIEVTRADGSTVAFRVTEVAEHPKTAFPTEAVYGPVAGPELRLITCSGPFDVGTGHYVDNLVVFATLA